MNRNYGHPLVWIVGALCLSTACNEENLAPDEDTEMMAADTDGEAMDQEQGMEDTDMPGEDMDDTDMSDTDMPDEDMEDTDAEMPDEDMDDTDMSDEEMSDIEEDAETDGEDSVDAGPMDESLCAEYGGAEVVESVVENNVIGAIAADCRISPFFTTLTEDGFTRVNDCLVIQVQELFGCEGITYEGAEASNGLPCRDMREAHLGLGISNADFDALIEDVVLGLSEAGVSAEHIEMAAPALLAMEEDIVEEDTEDYTESSCEPQEQDAGASDAGTGEMTSTLCGRYGGAESVQSVVENQVIGAIAGDCRINTFFTTLTEDAFIRVQECLVIQVQELFACDGITYEGASASNGLPCRPMREAHLGLGISQADFDALLEDVVSGLSEAGVTEDDIAMAAPALLGMQSDIVEDESSMPTQSQCEMADGGAQ